MNRRDATLPNARLAALPGPYPAVQDVHPGGQYAQAYAPANNHPFINPHVLYPPGYHPAHVEPPLPYIATPQARESVPPIPGDHFSAPPVLTKASAATRCPRNVPLSARELFQVAQVANETGVVKAEHGSKGDTQKALGDRLRALGIAGGDKFFKDRVQDLIDFHMVRP